MLKSIMGNFWGIIDTGILMWLDKNANKLIKVFTVFNNNYLYAYSAYTVPGFLDGKTSLLVTVTKYIHTYVRMWLHYYFMALPLA